MDQNNRYSLERMIDEDGVNDMIASLEVEYEGKKVADNISPFVTAVEFTEFESRVPVVKLDENDNPSAAKKGDGSKNSDGFRFSFFIIRCTLP